MDHFEAGGEIQRASGDQGRKLAEAMTGHKRWRFPTSLLHCPPAGDAGSVDGRLLIFSVRESLGWPVEANGGQSVAQDGVCLFESSAGNGLIFVPGAPHSNLL